MPEVEVVWPLAAPVDRARRCEAGLPRPHQHLAICLELWSEVVYERRRILNPWISIMDSPGDREGGYALKKDTVVSIDEPSTTKDALTEMLREGAQKLLAEAVQAELGELLEKYEGQRDGQGRKRLVRNGYLPMREIQTGIGGIPVRIPRVRDRGSGEESEEIIRFRSSLVPPYLRRSKSMEELLPLLYLKGISTGDFSDALSALLGTDAPGLSAKTISRLKGKWVKDYEKWRLRDLSKKRYVYIWADGLHVNVRFDDARLCLLVLIGARADGKKELIAVEDGYRESEQSWWELLRNLRSRGLRMGPKLALGDGALGFWKAPGQDLRQYPTATLLGAQDRQCAQQSAQGRSAKSQDGAAADLDG